MQGHYASHPKSDDNQPNSLFNKPKHTPTPFEANMTKQNTITTLLLAILLMLTACSGTHVELVSSTQPYALEPAITTAVYSYKDENTVDIFLTDIDPDLFRPSSDGEPQPPIVGQITQISMFIRPFPGRTPIDPTAANAAVRHAVFTGNGTGIYAGGGFLLPKSSAQSGTFRATTSQSTLVLRALTPGFEDRLGPVRLRAKLRADHDERTARRMRLAIDKIADQAAAAPDRERTESDSSDESAPEPDSSQSE